MPYVTLVCGRAKRICEPHWQIPLLPHTNGYGPLANGFSSEFAIQGHLVLGPLVPGLWLDASLTAFGVPPAPHTAKWASWGLAWPAFGPGLATALEIVFCIFGAAVAFALAPALEAALALFALANLLKASCSYWAKSLACGVFTCHGSG